MRGGDGGVDGACQINERLVAAQLLQDGGFVRLVVQPDRHLLGDLVQPPLRVRRFRVLLLGVGQLLENALGLEGQCAGLDGEGQLVVVAVDDAAADRFLDVGDLELTRGLGAQAGGLGHLQVEQLSAGYHQREEDDPVADAMPEDERRSAVPDLHRLAGTTLARPRGPARWPWPDVACGTAVGRFIAEFRAW